MVFYILIGIVIGIVLTALYFLFKKDGALVIDTSDPEKDIYRLELNYLEKLSGRHRLYLDVRRSSIREENKVLYEETNKEV